MQGFQFQSLQLSFARARMGYGKLPPFSKPPQSPHPTTDHDSQANQSIIFMCVLHKKFPSVIILCHQCTFVNQKYVNFLFFLFLFLAFKTLYISLFMPFQCNYVLILPSIIQIIWVIILLQTRIFPGICLCFFSRFRC